MARRYEIDELLWLRSSPLVAKPPGLPPIEEWMPQPDPTTQRKQQTTRDPNNPTETTSNRRPSFFEPRHISRGSNSEDVLLTSPKNVFASSRMGSKGSLDMTDRPVRSGNPDDKIDRFAFRDRFFKDRDPAESDGRPGGLNGRRGDKEDWNAGRPRRTFGPDDQERKPRRNGEFDRWDNRETPRDTNDERGNRDKDGRFPPKKDGQPARSKFEGSWFRNENTADGPDAADDDKPLRNREWRRDRHGADRDWNRGAKFDQEPEWLDSNDRDEPRRAHTQEDFQRWKERMKAGSGAAQAPAQEEKRDAPAESYTAAQQPEPHHTDGSVFSNERSGHSAAPFMADNSMDRFFGMLGGEKPPAQDVGTPIPVEAVAKHQVFAGKPSKSSRFAGLFSPPPESPSKAPESPAVPMAFAGGASSNPDREGFDRIIAMLGAGGVRSNSGTPNQTNSSQQSRPTSMVHAEQSRNISSPAREPYPRQDYASPVHENPLAHLAGKEPQAREREHLLRLMQQVRVGPGLSGSPAHQSPNATVAPPPGLMPEMMPRPPPGLGGPQKTPNFLDDPAIANMQRPDSEQLRRRAANGPPMGYFDDVPFPPGPQGPITPGGSRHSQGPNQPPMPLQRPPGLEHVPPPGWTGQPPPQPGNGLSPMGHPPGIPTPGRGMNPNFPPGMMPMPGNAPPLNERQTFPRGPPPGMMPPPGFMGAPPPPGFPPMPPNPEAMMGLGPGGQGPFGPGNPGHQGPPPSSRHLLEMFGQSNGGDGRGGMVGPPQFR